MLSSVSVLLSPSHNLTYRSVLPASVTHNLKVYRTYLRVPEVTSGHPPLRPPVVALDGIFVGPVDVNSAIW